MPKSIDQYEGAWWVRLGRVLRLSRFEVFEVDATPQECIEFIFALKNITYTDVPNKSDVFIDTLKKPYSFVYMGYELSPPKPAAKVAYIKGNCLGKGGKTLVEIEALPSKDVITGSSIGGLFSGAMMLGLFLMTVERLLLPSYKLTPDVLCLWGMVIFMLLGSCISPYSYSNSGVNRLKLYLASFHTTTPAQLEETPRQNSAQGSPSL